MENIVIFYDRLAYFTAIGNISFPFDIFCGNLVYCPPFWYFGPIKIWQPCLRRVLRCFAQVKIAGLLYGVDRRFIFRPNIQILVNFFSPWNGTFGYIIRPF
jgi:hypothetical protein